MRMPRQRHHTKTAPHRNFVSIIEQTIRPKRRLAQQPSPHPFRHTSDSSESRVPRTILIVLLITLRSGNPRSVVCSKCRRIPHMVQMPVREQNTANRQRIPTPLHQRRMQCPLPANKAGVDEIQPLTIPQDEKLHDECADDEQIRRHADSYRLDSSFS